MVGVNHSLLGDPEVGSFRSRPRRVEAIYFDGDNLSEVIEFLRQKDPDCLHVTGEWELDGETNEPVDCRIVDVTTADGLMGIEYPDVWVAHSAELGVELLTDTVFEATFQPLVTAAMMAA